MMTKLIIDIINTAQLICILQVLSKFRLNEWHYNLACLREHSRRT